MAMIELRWRRGHRVLVLIQRDAADAAARGGDPELACALSRPSSPSASASITTRQAVHEAERGPRSWDARWTVSTGSLPTALPLAVAGRLLPGESEAASRAGYAALFGQLGIGLDATTIGLVLFPEMDAAADVPEISEGCWDILGLTPAA